MAAAREIVTNDYNSVVIVLIVLGALVVLTRVDMTRRLPTVFLCAAATALSVIALGNIFYSRYILSQNICDRFHAPFVAIGACCFVVALFGQLQEQESTARARRASTILIICSWLLSAHVSSMAGGGVKSSLDRLRISVEEARNNNIWRLASDLRPYQMDGEQRSQLLVTEAGRIAYYSKFDTIDAWGLNSPQYSESPLDDPAEVARIAPLIINIHGYPLLPSYSYLNAPTKDAGPPQRDWVRMTQAIFKGAVASRAYSVFAVPFSVDGTALNGDRFDLILVRADRPHTQDIEAVILAHRGEALGRADLIGQEVLAKYRP